MGVIFITHNIHHVFEVADRFTIITHGRKLGDFPKGVVSLEEVGDMIMSGQVPSHLAQYAVKNGAA
jgi:simple sugar transport system ATP-binding protein